MGRKKNMRRLSILVTAQTLYNLHIREWNTHAPILSAEEMEMLEGMK